MTETMTLSCHCGGTKLAVRHKPESVTQCTCSYCTKTGGLWSYYAVDEVEVLEDAHGAIYSPTTPHNEHHLCTRCGCSTYTITPDYSLEDTGIPDRRKASVNARLLDDYALFVSLPVKTIDGRNLW